MTQQRDNRGRFAAGAGASAVGAGVAGVAQHRLYQLNRKQSEQAQNAHSQMRGFQRKAADARAEANDYKNAADKADEKSSRHIRDYPKHIDERARQEGLHESARWAGRAQEARTNSDAHWKASGAYSRSATAAALEQERLRRSARLSHAGRVGSTVAALGLGAGALTLGVKAMHPHEVSKRDIVIRVRQEQQHREPRHTYTDGRLHRDTKGRFASAGAAGAATVGIAGGTIGAAMTGIAHSDVVAARRDADQTARDFMDAARQGRKPMADKLAGKLKGFEEEEKVILRARNKLALYTAAPMALGAAGMYAHGRINRRVGRLETPVAKGWKERADSLRVTPEQARTAGTFGQIGAAGGTLGGAAIGAGIGAATRHPAQGAGLGALAGGAIGGGSGAALGLYGARPRKKKKLAGTAPSTLSKAFDGKKRGAVIGAGSGLAAGGLIQAGATAASSRLKEEAQVAGRGDRLRKPGGKSGVFHDPLHAGGDLAAYKHKMGDARLLERTAAFHGSAKGRVGMAVGGALTGAALVRHHQRKIAGQVDIAKMSDETKTKLARGGLVGAQIADVAAIKSAWHETSTAKKTGTGIGSALSYGAKKAALPIVAGGLVASIGAERVMHSQQKKLKAAQTANLKPRKVAP